VAYRADIEIAVKGGRELKTVSDQLGQLSVAINNVNKAAKLQGVIPASINNYRSAVEQANRSVLAAASGTKVQKQAIDLYVKSLYQAEQAEKKLSVAIAARQKELGIANRQTTRPSSGRVGGVVGNAVIGGAFPLLFGQGGGAATGGAIGGALGGLLGGTGGFAGSLLGTLLGGIAEQGNKIKEVAADIGFTAEQTKQLQQAFRLAGQDAEKFTDAVQNIRGLGLSIEEQANAVRLVSQLTEIYGGKIDKVANAFTSALESGKVTQATLNQLTSQGIPIQDALAAKYKVSRNAIVTMAKDGQISVQALADVLVDMGNKGIQAGEKPKTAFEQFNVALGNTVTAVTNVASALYTVLAPAIDTIITKATLALNALTETINTELLRTQIQSQSGKIVSPARLKQIEKEAMDMAARRYPSEAKGRQLAAGAGIISPRAQQEFQILREQGIRNELQRFGYEQGILKTPKNTTAAEIGRITAPAQMPPKAGKKDKSADDAKRRAEQLKKQLEYAARLAVETDYELQISYALTEQEKLQASYDKERLERMNKYETLYTNSLSLQEREYLLTAQTNEINRANNEYQKARVELVTAEVEAMYNLLGVSELLSKSTQQRLPSAFGNSVTGSLFTTDQALVDLNPKGQQIREFIADAEAQLKNLEAVALNISKGIGDTVANSLTSGIQGLIAGTATAKEVFATFLSDVGQILAQEGAKMIATYIAIGIAKMFAGLMSSGSATGIDGSAAGKATFGGSFAGTGSSTFGPNGITIPGFGARANGGPVTGGSPYVVGERGPELFVPGTGGSVVSNNDLRSAMGSAPGMGGSPVLNMSFETSTINGVEYVSRDQLEAAMVATRRQAARDGANRGMTMTLDRLQQSPSTRRKVGI
jgi:tape measure domain-containing protein